MDASLLLQLLLPNASLSAGQVVRMRALDIRYWSAIYAFQHRVKAIGGMESSPSETEMTALDASIVAHVREILTTGQRRTFERNLPRLEDDR
jgi:hypothetical protein